MTDSLITPLSPLATFSQGYQLELNSGQASTDPLRAQFEAFIHQRFAETYGATVKHYMPQLLGLRHKGALQAVVGLRPASASPLFLEQYLDIPACTQIRQRSGIAMQREQMIEVGNLAALAPGAARMLIIALTHYLAAQGFSWVVFTGTAMLLNSFQRLALSPIDLGMADPARLGRQQAEWGSYYATRPRVMAGYIPEGLAQLNQRDAFQRLGYQARYAQPQEANHASA
ncbi:thermostable hemolysin [Halopseudomonas pelagia]|uniref:Thermostable hemolysin n=1 Tax=Halopseudomonas pelagia TaxID=553151 RepID=A0AA91U480_9GAMM|nr:thermostable hemolysin [Halopseudomonas pelagia]PCD00509.1 thermostable hemolysin [Halopseudomonas pelagia]QFY55212.1 thermostable hemolysin [Halopseudomonas pelagia]